MDSDNKHGAYDKSEPIYDEPINDEFVNDEFVNDDVFVNDEFVNDENDNVQEINKPPNIFAGRKTQRESVAESSSKKVR
ncbi:3666_t:CDS:1, partial [Dentiscutata erythropus]